LNRERDDHQRSCYGGGGVVKDTTGRGFRSSLDRPAAAKGSPFRLSSRGPVAMRMEEGRTDMAGFLKLPLGMPRAVFARSK